MQKQTQRTDHVWRSALSNHTAIVRHSNSLRTVTRLLRQSIYRFAKDVLALDTLHHNEFLDLVKSTGSTLEQWLKEHFELVEAMGERRVDLLLAIDKGMTEKEYVSQGPTWLVRNRAKDQGIAKVDTDATVRIVKKAEKLPDGERADIYKSQLDAVMSELRELRRDNAILLKDNEQLRADAAKIERLASKRTRKTTSFIESRKTTKRIERSRNATEIHSNRRC